jgi:hypothetical protein
MREHGSDRTLVAVNGAEETATLWIPGKTLLSGKTRWRDLLSGDEFAASPEGLRIPLDPSWLRILV